VSEHNSPPQRRKASDDDDVKTRRRIRLGGRWRRRRGQIDERPAAGGDCRGRAAGVRREGVHGTTTVNWPRRWVSEGCCSNTFRTRKPSTPRCRFVQPAVGGATFERLQALKRVARRWLFWFTSLISHFLARGGPGDDEPAIQTRLMLQSILVDGEFARLRLGQIAECWIPKSRSLASRDRGRRGVEGPTRASVRGWLVHQLATGVRIYCCRPSRSSTSSFRANNWRSRLSGLRFAAWGYRCRDQRTL